MSRRTLERRIVALGLAAMLALPGAALARPGRTVDPAPWTSLWTWFARLLAGIPDATASPHSAAGRLTTTTAKAGSTVDPDGRRTTAFIVVEPPVPTEPLPTGGLAGGGTLK